MASSEDVSRIALALPGTSSAPHFERIAFSARRIFVTLAGDGASINLKLTPDEQQFKTMMAPEVFAALPGAWGAKGWTSANLAAIGLDEFEAVIRTAYVHGAAPTKRR